MTQEATTPVVHDHPSDRIVVLHSLAPPDGTTKFVDQMVGSATPAIDVRTFTWRAALRGRYDVIHLHWPELLLRGRSPWHRFAKRQAMRLFLARASAHRTPIVRTLHNTDPHETGSRTERRILAGIDRRTDHFIRLNPATATPPHAPGSTVLHGHYRDRFAAHPHAARVPGRILYFGIIRRYKGVDLLIEAFERLQPKGATLRIVGSPSPDLRAEVEAAADRNADISARLAFVDDDELVAEVTAADLVVLPYREMHNSGVLLVALSLGQRVLVPRSPSNTAIAAEVGPDWVLQYDGEFGDDALSVGLRAMRAGPPHGEPDLSGRDWSSVGTRLEGVYRSVLGGGAR